MNELIRILHPAYSLPAQSPWLLSMRWAYMTPSLNDDEFNYVHNLKGSKATGLSHNLE